MKIDLTTYKKEGPIGMTASLYNQPNKVLFFAEPLFLFLKHTAIGTFTFAQKHKANLLAKSKESIFPMLY